MPRVGFLFLNVGAAGALAALCGAGTPGWEETVLAVAVFSAAGALVAAVAENLTAGGGTVFGKKNDHAAAQEEAAKEAAAVETVMSAKIAQDAAAALAGIKSLIESLEITDRRTWERVASLAKEAEAALTEVQEAAERAGRGASRAAEAFRGIAALVEGK